MVDLKEVEMLFVAYENGKKCFLTKPKNKYYNILSLIRLGNFSENGKYFSDENTFRSLSWKVV